MSLTFSNPFTLGAKAPDFTLPNVVSGHNLVLSSLNNKKAYVIMFICNHCPYVIHIKEDLVKLANEYAPKGVAFIAISSNDADAFPQDGPEKMKEDALRHNYPFPYLYDATQKVAKDYKAACTPDFYVFDADQKCTYHGRFDDSSPKNELPKTGVDLRAAINATMQSSSIPADSQKPSSGCNIKWKSGVSPF